MKTDFKVYPRKINVFMRTALACDPSDMFYKYAWSTNAYRTCREAIAAARELHPSRTFKANFAKE